MSDLISREEAVALVNRAIRGISDKDAQEYLFDGLRKQMWALPSAEPKTGWIPCSERLPSENEYVGNVCKYYLIQDEYGDMHVAHLSSRGWEPIESIKALGCDVIAWMPLPEPYKGGDDE